MKILMILSNPFISDPRVYNEAKALTEDGHEVTVIIWDRKHKYDTKQVFEGIKLIRIHNDFLMDVLPHDLFRNPLWWRKSFKKGMELFKSGFQFDVVHCHDLDTLWAGMKLKRKTGCHLIYDAHEIFGYMIMGNVSPIFVKLAFYLEKKLIKKVDYIITVNKKVKQYFNKISTAPILLVMNCKELQSKKYKAPKNKIFTVCYIGNLHRRRLFPQIVSALGKVDKIKLVIAGKKENIKLFNEVKKVSSKYENVIFLGEIPSNQVIPYTYESDMVIHPTDPLTISSQIGTPNKLFDAMACGRPILCSKGTNPGDIVEDIDCGLTVEYDVDSFTKGVIRLRDNKTLCERLGKNGLKAAIERYNWKSQKNNLLNLYNKIKDQNH